MKLVSILAMFFLVSCGGEVTYSDSDSLYRSFDMPSSEVNELNLDSGMRLLGISFSDMYFKFTRDNIYLRATCDTPDGSRDLEVSSPIIVHDDYFEIVFNDDTTEYVGDYECNLALQRDFVDYSFNSFGDLVLTAGNSYDSLTLRER